jgi:hypothetical protein
MLSATSLGLWRAWFKRTLKTEGNMRFLMTLAYWEGVILFGGLFGVVLWKLLTGGISLSYLLDGDVQDPDSPTGFSTTASPGRIQAIMVTLFVAGYYVLQVIHNPREFPKLPNAMVGTLAGSHVLYLGGKAQAMLSGRMRDLFR